ncbi:MraY family glycosyltransferase [Algoriphagus sediminis]|uniref:MraY family glycosyltransferase n=1 Tax=Algoriphagus sediminis TaxID=3057113 RepID=A0ABT7YDU1_9BACT|nr:MraY family glycosyltransferase [Algoriphagus sediminis]MDN3204658.1 MraY family glycosyltransferase [Algoriphagus sediminis]
MDFLFAAVIAFAIALLFFPILIKVLKNKGLGDQPGGRKIHKKFIPSMGGIAIYAAAAVSLAIWAWQFPIPDVRYLLGAISIMFFVGLRDDLVELKASHKIAGQLVAVLLVVVVSDIRIKDLHGFLGVEELNLYFSYAFSAFVILALTNAFNLIDGLDGLAGTIASITFAFLGAWFYIQGLESYALVSFVFLGAILAFLCFNWHPAKIFMGDTGSLTLGFALGALVIAFMEVNAALPEGSVLKFQPTFTTGIALMLFPLYDMARVFARRISKGLGPMTPDKSHVHHFLMRMGLRHDQVALILGITQVAFIALAFLLKDFSDHIALPIISAVVLFMGYRLDKVTVKYVKKKVVKEPRVLEKKNRKTRKAVVDRKGFKDSTINLN